MVEERRGGGSDLRRSMQKGRACSLGLRLFSPWLGLFARRGQISSEWGPRYKSVGLDLWTNRALATRPWWPSKPKQQKIKSKAEERHAGNREGRTDSETQSTRSLFLLSLLFSLLSLFSPVASRAASLFFLLFSFFRFFSFSFLFARRREKKREGNEKGVQNTWRRRNWKGNEISWKTHFSRFFQIRVS